MTERFNKVKSTKETIHYNGIEDTEKEVIYNYGKQDDFLEDITQLLNELNDENEDLKSQLKNLRKLSNILFLEMKE